METTAKRKTGAYAERLAYTFIDSPVGRLLLAGDERGLWQLSFVRKDSPIHVGDAWLASENAFQDARQQLGAYFAGELRRFEVRAHLVGTEFQLAVWNALLSIPYGSTWSYGDLARAVAKPAAVRAVGGANHANPVSIVVPCHRVIGSNGKLVGYGGGLDVKARLLALERGDFFA
jgi:methylated-DNA-[protein]-cysteine S-methyltransferase